jgi:hypothetical protein
MLTPSPQGVNTLFSVEERRGGQRIITPGANPTIASYNASVVNFYNATGSLARFENKRYYLPLLKTL